jgi:hypothetical protein
VLCSLQPLSCFTYFLLISLYSPSNFSSSVPLHHSILGQCQVPFPAPAVRKGSSYFKSSPQTAPMNTSKGIGASSSSGAGIGMALGGGGLSMNGSSNSNNHSNNSTACASSSSSSSSTHRNHSSTHTKNKFFAANSSAATAPEVVFKGPTSNTNSSQFSSFREGHNFTAHELWLRMKTKGKLLLIFYPYFCRLLNLSNLYFCSYFFVKLCCFISRTFCCFYSAYCSVNTVFISPTSKH